jgi:hypothetical protein
MEVGNIAYQKTVKKGSILDLNRAGKLQGGKQYKMNKETT